MSQPTISESDSDIYFEVLELQPVMLSVSIMRTDRVNTDSR
jgi:hypothetical protein